ncbi:MAG: hypothetical protein IH598_12995, partial [Bacteroidales bacterium]|nr:hypothetical protein [Bacteroidales bacterium]
PGSLSTTYTPGILDIAAGEVILSITAFSGNGCNNATSALSVAIEKSPTIDAADDFTICETDFGNLTATGENYSSVLWTTDGDGFFSNALVLNPVYYPGEEDIANGEVNITITAFAMNLCNYATDYLNLYVQKSPHAFAGEDQHVIAGDSVVVNDAIVEDNSGLLWTSSGSGTFDDPTDLHSVYYPSQMDYDSESVILTLYAFPFEHCLEIAEDQIQVSFDPDCEDALADAGDDFMTCFNDSVLVAGYAQYQQSVVWQTSGDGNFANPAAFETVYYPGLQDKLSGHVNLSFTAFAFPNCANDTDYLNITFNEPPQVNAGVDQTICESEVYIVLSGSASGQSSVLWTTSGDGFFIFDNVISPYYYFGQSDKANGEVTFTLTAYSNLCPPVSDQVLIDITRTPIVFAGDAAAICAGELFQTNDAFTANYDYLLWSTSGDGYFDAPDQLNTTYHPGELDVINGLAELCLKAFALSPCADDEHCFTLTFLPNATVSAGEDMSVCESQTVSLSATAENDESVLWE